MCPPICRAHVALTCRKSLPDVSVNLGIFSEGGSMRRSILLVVPLLAWVACSSSSSDGAGGGDDSSNPGSPGADGGTSTTTDGGTLIPEKDSGTTTITTADGGTFTAGNPDGSCKAGVPAGGNPADVSTPTTVVGTGTAASCTFAALNTAATTGGIITFNCGAGATTINVTATLNVPITKDTVIDGGGKITLDGGGSVQIMTFNGTDWQTNEHRLTLQHIALINGKIAGSMPIHSPPPEPACSQGFDKGEGGAVYVNDGNLTVIDSIFANNEAGSPGPDIGGGAIRMLGSKHGALIVSSTFSGNHASNGGGVGCLFSELDIYNSLFTGNNATGHDANNAGTVTDCSQMNAGQYELGSGGNGGAFYSDGAQQVPPAVATPGPISNIVLCGDKIVDNNAGTKAFGGGIFFTSNDYSGSLSITDTTMTGNTGGSWTNVQTGSTNNAGSAVGTNTKSLTIVNSTLQGVP
jgi:hypothetical protein